MVRHPSQHQLQPTPFLGRTKPPEAAAGRDTLVLRAKTLLASMAHGRTDRTSRRAEIPPPEMSPQRGGRPPWRSGAKRRLLSGGGLSALRLLRLVQTLHSCAMLAKSIFFLKTTVLCPAAAAGGFVRPKNWSMLEVVQESLKSESSQNGLV